jgi:hypothetical protein
VKFRAFLEFGKIRQYDGGIYGKFGRMVIFLRIFIFFVLFSKILYILGDVKNSRSIEAAVIRVHEG